jgi:hypothetical protein
MPDRNRFRYRLRLGITAALTDNLDFGLRLGSGEVNGDPISLNQSMQDNGSRKPIGLDLAYLRWSPINRGDLSVSLSGGKIENPFVLSELVFDPDYTPEGAAQQFVYNLNGNHALKLNVGEFVLDELSASSLDPYLLGVQLRWEGVLSKRIGATLGLTGLGILGRQGLKTGNVPDVSQGNTRLADGNLVYNYTPVVGDAALTYTFESFPMYAGPFPVRVGAEFAHNPGAPSQNRGWDAMLAFGKAGKRRTWELAYKYKVLEGDFWFEELVDSDFGAYYKSTPVGGRGSGYQAGTNTRGHVMKASYSPYDALTLSATYYLAEAVKPFPAHSGSTIGRLQVDAVLKF